MNTFNLKTLFAFLPLAGLTIILVACKKTGVGDPGTVPEKLVSASIAGRVTDLNNLPISNASVTAGTITSTTDNNGQFNINNAQLVKDAGCVKVSAPGYFDGARTFITSEAAINNVKIKLIPKTISGNFPAGSGGTITVSGGGELVFGSSSVVNAATKVAYTGTVSVSTRYLNPTDQNFKEFMPGDLRGINTGNQKSILKMFGMESIEMQDAGGEKLQLASGKAATITLPIPASLQGNAPATLPLWYFDETTGLWKQEGTATKQGANYVGQVNHFSFWAAGELISSVVLTATFIDTSLAVYANKSVVIYRPDSTSAGGYTNGDGTISGLVPANEILTVKVFGDCGSLAYTETIGPLSADLDLGLTVVDDNCSSVVPDSTDYISLDLGGIVYNMSSLIQQNYWDSTSGHVTSMQAYSDDHTASTSVFIYSGPTATAGDFNCEVYTSFSSDSAFSAVPYGLTVTTITEFGPIGGYIRGFASGWMKKSTGGILSGDSIAFICNYRVTRTN